MKVLICEPISPEARAQLAEFTEIDESDADSLLSKIEDSEVIIIRSKTQVTQTVMDAAPKLKAIIRAGVGTDNIDKEYAKTKNIQVINTPEAPTESVAEFVFALMFSLMRKVSQADRATRSKKWIKKELKGFELSGKTLGIVGFGRIGQRVASYAHAFHMKILVSDPFVDKERVKSHAAELVELDQLLEQSDIITLHTPLLDATRHIINSTTLEKMKSTAYLVNTARGELIEEEALHKALTTGQIAGAALDVYETEPPFDSPLLQLDNVVLTQHLGGSTKEAQERIGQLIVDKVRDLV